MTKTTFAPGDDESKRCPHCGYCPECGHSDTPPVVVYPQPVVYSVYPQPYRYYIYGANTGAATITNISMGNVA